MILVLNHDANPASGMGRNEEKCLLSLGQSNP